MDKTLAKIAKEFEKILKEHPKLTGHVNINFFEGGITGCSLNEKRFVEKDK